MALVGGETAVMPDALGGLVPASTCTRGTERRSLPGDSEAGDALVGWPSSGIHSNGLTLAREAVTQDHEYTDPFPSNADTTIAEALLTPTRIYSEVLAPLRASETHAAAHVTGGGWTNLTRMGSYRYEITTPSRPSPSSSSFRAEGEVSDEEMHRTFTWEPGSSLQSPTPRCGVLADSEDGRVIGQLADGDEAVAIRILELTE